uniref:Uncharacterized protein n=1 Tax=Solanum tuberosum TaxID=4113 RepID=M1CIA1_SOLTU
MLLNFGSKNVTVFPSLHSCHSRDNYFICEQEKINQTTFLLTARNVQSIFIALVVFFFFLVRRLLKKYFLYCIFRRHMTTALEII